MIDINNDLCGTVKVDGETIKAIKVGVHKVLTTQDNPVNIKQCNCGGFYLDEDVFHVMGHTITLKENTEVNQGFTTCGGVFWDGAVFRQEGDVVSLIPQQPGEDTEDNT